MSVPARFFHFDGFDSRRCVEPVKRMVGGRFGWVVHRFPIRGGLTMRESVLSDLVPNRPSALMRVLCGHSR